MVAKQNNTKKSPAKSTAPKPKIVRKKKKPVDVPPVQPQTMGEESGKGESGMLSPVGAILDAPGNPLFAGGSSPSSSSVETKAAPLRGGRSGSDAASRRVSDTPMDAWEGRSRRIRFADEGPERPGDREVGVIADQQVAAGKS